MWPRTPVAVFHSLKIAPAKRVLGVEALPKHGFGGAAGLYETGQLGNQFSGKQQIATLSVLSVRHSSKQSVLNQINHLRRLPTLKTYLNWPFFEIFAPERSEEDVFA